VEPSNRLSYRHAMATAGDGGGGVSTRTVLFLLGVSREEIEEADRLGP